jgi:hypothetical protein
MPNSREAKRRILVARGCGQEWGGMLVKGHKGYRLLFVQGDYVREVKCTVCEYS